MKSKKWLISLGLAVVLVVTFALPACETTPKEYWHTPEGEKISFDITTSGATYGDIGLMVVNDLQDFGLDVELEVMDTTSFYDYLYAPNLGGTEAFVYSDQPAPDPWSDWIWMMLGDPLEEGYMWNPCWYNSTAYNEMEVANYVSPNLSAKQELLDGLQEILAQDVPIHFLVRPQFIAVHRTDNWGNWYNEMGGYASWMNEWTFREITKLGDENQLKIGVLGLPSNLNHDQSPMMYTNVGCLYLHLVYENLAYYTKIGEDVEDAYDFVPKLWTGYSLSYEDDGTGGQNQVWTIDLREGVKWHDYDISGKNFTADDLIYSMKYLWLDWAANRPLNWTAVEEAGELLPEHVLVTKINDYQIELRYIEGWHQNEDYCLQTGWYRDYGSVPKHVLDAEGAPEDPMSWDGNYIGTGPYKVKEFVVDSHLLLERNDDYWGPLPEAEEVLFKLYNNSGTMFLALESGEIDGVMASAPFEKIDEYTANPDIEVDPVWDLAIYYMGFNLHPTEGYEPLQDVVLRQAIAYAIDKQDIADIALGGYAEVVYSFIYNESPNFNPDVTKYDYDTAAAETLLLDAGYTKHA
jgi:ABC-type transport system substrate-binding protein